MVRDTAQRVMLAFAIPCLVLAVVRGGLSVAFGWDAPEAGWFGTVAGLLLVAEMVYGRLRRRDEARAARPLTFGGGAFFGAPPEDMARQVHRYIKAQRRAAS